LAFSACFYSVQFAFAQNSQTDQTTLKLQVASNTVEQAFNTFSSAEKAGANVTALLNQLQGAANLLAQAENSYRIGDMNAAANFADQASTLAQQVGGQADAAKESATTSGQTAFLVTVASVVVGSFLLILGLFLGWRLFKRRYINNVLEAKPEVISN
jgi:hypothetical protein